jgi:hypothetical protein
MFTLGKHVSTSRIRCALASTLGVNVAHDTNLLNITLPVVPFPATGLEPSTGPSYPVQIQNPGQTAASILNISTFRPAPPRFATHPFMEHCRSEMFCNTLGTQPKQRFG